MSFPHRYDPKLADFIVFCCKNMLLLLGYKIFRGLTISWRCGWQCLALTWVVAFAVSAVECRVNIIRLQIIEYISFDRSIRPNLNPKSFSYTLSLIALLKQCKASKSAACSKILIVIELSSITESDSNHERTHIFSVLGFVSRPTCFINTSLTCSSLWRWEYRSDPIYRYLCGRLRTNTL